MHIYMKCWIDLFKEQFTNVYLLNFGQNYFVQLRWNWLSVWAWGMWACSLFLSLLSAQLLWNRSTNLHESVVMMDILCRWAHSQTIVHSFASFELRHLAWLSRCNWSGRAFANYFMRIVKTFKWRQFFS